VMARVDVRLTGEKPVPAREKLEHPRWGASYVKQTRNSRARS
jgi:hypothetical protein